MRVRVYVAFKLTLVGLGGIAAFTSNPDYYLWTIISVLTCVGAYFAMMSSDCRKLLVKASVAIGLLCFIVGRFFFKSHMLDGDGIFLVLVLGVIPAVIVAWSVYSAENELAKSSGALA